MRLLLALFFVLLGFVFAALSVYNGRLVLALALAFAGIYVGLSILLGIANSLQNLNFQAAAAIIGVISILNVYVNNRFFDTTLQRAHFEALTEFQTIEHRCRPMSAELRNIQKFGIRACALQRNSDQMGVVVEFGKSLYFGPTLTLGDTIITSGTGETPNYCAQAFKAADQLCPLAFFAVREATRNALFEAAK